MRVNFEFTLISIKVLIETSSQRFSKFFIPLDGACDGGAWKVFSSLLALPRLSIDSQRYFSSSHGPNCFRTIWIYRQISIGKSARALLVVCLFRLSSVCLRRKLVNGLDEERRKLLKSKEVIKLFLLFPLSLGTCQYRLLKDLMGSGMLPTGIRDSCEDPKKAATARKHTKMKRRILTLFYYAKLFLLLISLSNVLLRLFFNVT